MVRVRFQNGPEAPEIVLDDQFETKEAARERLDWFTETFGTVPGAAAWIDGEKKPRFQGDEDAPAAKPIAGETPATKAPEAPHPPDEAAKEARAAAEAEEKKTAAAPRRK